MCVGYSFLMAKQDDDLRPINEAAELAEVHRNTLGRWVKAGKLKPRRELRGNMMATLVSLAEVRRLVGEGLKPGRPPEAGKAESKGKGSKKATG